MPWRSKKGVSWRYLACGESNHLSSLLELPRTRSVQEEAKLGPFKRPNRNKSVKSSL
jgi:hypothetical protein